MLYRSVLVIFLAVAEQLSAGTVTDLGTLKNGTKIRSVQSADGRWELETEGPGASSATRFIPIQIAYSSTKPGTPALERGYDSIRRSGQGFEGVAAVPGPGGVIFHVHDQWTFHDEVLSVARRIAVSGNASGGFLSSVAFSVKGSFPRSQVDMFAPGMIYGGTAHLTPSAIGGALTYSEGQGKLRIREVSVALHDFA